MINEGFVVPPASEAFVEISRKHVSMLLTLLTKTIKLQHEFYIFSNLAI